MMHIQSICRTIFAKALASLKLWRSGQPKCGSCNRNGIWRQSQSKKRAVLFAVIGILLVFVVFNFAQAQAGAEKVPKCGLLSGAPWSECLNYYLLSAITTIGAFLVSWAAWFIQLALSFNKGITNGPIVQNGFKATLAVVNLGFVLTILVIAIATILDIERYGLKKILWKLIVAALLVNFSLVIASTIVGVSDQFTWFFTNRIGGEGGIVNQFQKVFQTNEIFSVDMGKAWSWGQVMLNAVFMAAFFFAIIFTMVAIAIMLMIRFMYLSFLFILMPLAWFCWVIPDLEKHWRKWWDYFLRYTFFAPLVMLFLWIAVVGVTGTPDSTEGQKHYVENIIASSTMPDMTGNSAPAQAASQIMNTRNVGGKGLLQNAMQTLVAVGFMWGGLFVANSMSVAGASATWGMVNKMKGSIEGRVKNKASHYRRRAADRVRRARSKDGYTGLQRMGSFIASSRLRHFPGMKSLGAAVARQGVVDSEKYKDDIENAKKKYAGFNNDALLTATRSLLSKPIRNPAEAVALSNLLSERDQIKNLDKEGENKYTQKLLDTTEKIGKPEGIYATRPDLAATATRYNKKKDRQETELEAIKRAIKGIKYDELDKISPDALKKMDVILSLTKDQLRAFARRGTAQQKDIIRNMLAKLQATPSLIDGADDKLDINQIHFDPKLIKTEEERSAAFQKLKNDQKEERRSQLGNHLVEMKSSYWQKIGDRYLTEEESEKKAQEEKNKPKIEVKENFGGEARPESKKTFRI